MASLHRVELVPEEDPAVGGSARAAPVAGDRPPGARRRNVRTVVGASAVLLVLGVALGSWVTTTRERDRLAVPGAVESLAVAPVPVWGTDAADPQVLALGDVLAVAPGDGLAGLDAASGDRRWRALDATARCGPGPDESAGTAPPPAARPASVTCLTGPPRAPVAHVLAADGTVSPPVALGDGPGRSLPTPGGTVLRWDRTGGVVHLALQDARTASVRWQRDVRPDDLARTTMCRPQVAASALVTVEAGLLVVRGCRVSAVLDLDGRRLDDDGEAVTLDVQPLPDGDHVRSTSPRPGTAGSTQLVAPDGTVLGEVPGRALRPLAGGDARTVLVAGPAGVDALDPTRSAPAVLDELWHLDTTVTQVVALAGGVAVLAVEGRVVAVDARTGTPAWSWPPAEREVDLSRGVLGAFTDGATVALIVPDPDTARRSRMVALSLADGSVRWDAAYDADPRGFRAVGGRLVHVDPTSSRVVVHG